MRLRAAVRMNPPFSHKNLRDVVAPAATLAVNIYIADRRIPVLPALTHTAGPARNIGLNRTAAPR